MEIHRRGQRLLGCRHTGDVIDMSVREKDVSHVEQVRRHGGKQFIDLVAGVDQQPPPRRLVGETEPFFMRKAAARGWISIDRASRYSSERSER